MPVLSDTCPNCPSAGPYKAPRNRGGVIIARIKLTNDVFATMKAPLMANRASARTVNVYVNMSINWSSARIREATSLPPRTNLTMI